MTLFILTSNNRRIPFHQPQRTPLVLKSIQKLKEQARKNYNYRAQSTKVKGEMKGKQFGSLDIVVTRGKCHAVKIVPIKKKNGHTTVIDKMAFPEDLDISFNQGLLTKNENGFENSYPDVEAEWKQKAHNISWIPASPSSSDSSLKKYIKPTKPTVLRMDCQLEALHHKLPRPKLNGSQKKPEFTLDRKTITRSDKRGYTVRQTPPIPLEEVNFTGDFQEQYRQQWRVPETPYLKSITKADDLGGPFTVPETPQLIDISRHAVPETPMLDASTTSFQQDSPQFLAPETIVQQASCCKGIWRKKHIQVVPETPLLKLSPSDDISLYE